MTPIEKATELFRKQLKELYRSENGPKRHWEIELNKVTGQTELMRTLIGYKNTQEILDEEYTNHINRIK